MVHGGNDISYGKALDLRERRKNVTDVVFLLNITTIGEYACKYCVSLVTVVVPEGIESIGEQAFRFCTSLLNVTFPKSLKSICYLAFCNCTKYRSHGPLPHPSKFFWHTSLLQLLRTKITEASNFRVIKQLNNLILSHKLPYLSITNFVVHTSLHSFLVH